MYVCEGLREKPEEYMPCLALNVSKNGKTLAGVLINDLREGVDCWMTIYSSSPEWAKRSTLKYIFGVVFNLMQCQRCSVFVSASNLKSLNMCLRLGFKIEGVLRQYRSNGEDCYVMGMLKNECIWRDK
jgi:hypothetical protein